MKQKNMLLLALVFMTFFSMSCSASETPKQIVEKVIESNFSSSVLFKFAADIDKNMFSQGKVTPVSEYAQWLYKNRKIEYKTLQESESQVKIEAAITGPDAQKVISRFSTEFESLSKKYPYDERTDETRAAYSKSFYELIMNSYITGIGLDTTKVYVFNFIKENNNWKLLLNLKENIAKEKEKDEILKQEILQNLEILYTKLEKIGNYSITNTIRNNSDYDLKSLRIDFQISYLDNEGKVFAESNEFDYYSAKKGLAADVNFYSLRPPAVWKNEKYTIKIIDIDLPSDLKKGYFSKVFENTITGKYGIQN